ncbi:MULTISPECIES: SDR family NAD(P)-dependent oxidoreductase [unclassified Nocardioides]|uniref:SDR family NAD(P)-dependent oxidoreductase n=1 Tax=unclassified Nocardioides TaxID=2615069 RepID=UPI0006FB13C1|nr:MULTISPECIES: SDR family NAD(P)-dependent oxidoreductase [unclassified Nocardioides]KQY62594.1 short-chain dehydrogenase [Nocardioides sp. Root140]KQZ76006.1 short-chain dehydrogenase [Nocardioides sp. Root151]KRF15079.1 short-chain dehydrogenase [Nocardioides sp. Soil796]
MSAGPGRRVLVTGAASGLGAALVSAFSARGDRVLATDLDVRGLDTGAERLTRPAEGVERLPRPAEGVERPTRPAELKLDITSDDDWAAALAWVEREWGGLDVLVNNAGVAGGGRLDVATMDEWEWITRINLFGVVRGTRTFVPMFKAQRSGHIVNVASLAGLVHPAGMASYNAVKAAVVALSETTGHELAAYDVRCSVVCPSYFRTNLMDGLQGADTALGAVMSQLVENSPFTADDIARAVLEGMDRGEDVIIPDKAARGAVDLKQNDRAAYDAVMRKQAARLDQMG